MKLPRRHQVPPLDMPVLRWWADAWDHVYVVPHPLFQVPGADPATRSYGPQHINTTPADLLARLRNRRWPPPTLPEGFEGQIKTSGIPHRWADVARAIAAPDPLMFARTLWLHTVQVQRADTDTALRDRLIEYCAAHHLYLPEEDQLAIILEPALHRYFTALGLTEFSMRNAFDTVQRDAVPLAALSRAEPPLAFPGEKICRIFSDRLPFYLSWSFDDIWALLCLPEAVRALAPPEEYFECFPLAPGQYPDWLNPPAMSPRLPPAPHA
jgi:hypothetical protein